MTNFTSYLEVSLPGAAFSFHLSYSLELLTTATSDKRIPGQSPLPLALPNPLAEDAQ